jgi:hypothetical protein
MRKSPIGTIGVTLGLTALAIAIFHFWLGSFNPTDRPLSQTLTEKAHTLKESLKAKIKGEGREDLEDQSQFEIDRAIIITSVTAAFLAIVCGVISFLKREDLRYSATAAVMGGSALAFHFIIVAIGIAVILVLIVTVLNR